MSVAAIKLPEENKMRASETIATVLSELEPQFAERAAAADDQDRFVAENFADLKAHGLVAAGVPEELGGLGAGHAELCARCCDALLIIAARRG